MAASISKTDDDYSKSELADERRLRQHHVSGRLTMIVTVFRSRLMPDVREEYVALVDRMVELAATMPGYVSHKGFFADDGERVTIVEFEHEEGMRAWRMHPEHRAAQKKASEIYYSEYSIQVCNVVRESKFKRDERVTAG
jgi:heme-degrading monooxygenase HmoA